MFPWGADLSSDLVSEYCYVTSSHQFQEGWLNSFGCQHNLRQDPSASTDRVDLYTALVNCWSSLILESLHILMWKWIKIFNSLIHFNSWDRCQNLPLSSMDWFPFNSCLSRPGLLNAGDPSYPWLADSWPATSLPVNNSNTGPNEIGNFGRGGKLCFSKFCYLFSWRVLKKTHERIFSSIIKFSETHVLITLYIC